MGERVSNAQELFCVEAIWLGMEYPTRETRRRVPTGGFLSGLPPDMAKMFQYFYKVMMCLREDVTEKEFEGVLGDYLEKFVETG